MILCTLSQRETISLLLKKEKTIRIGQCHDTGPNQLWLSGTTPRATAACFSTKHELLAQELQVELQALYSVKHMLSLLGACCAGDSWAEQLIAAEVSRPAG